MENSNLTITVRPKARLRKFSVELDADSFERLAADLGLFREEFIASIEQAEREIAQGKMKKLRSLVALGRK